MLRWIAPANMPTWARAINVACFVAIIVLVTLALCSCAHVKWGNPGSSGYEGEIKPVFPSLTPAPCKEEGP